MPLSQEIRLSLRRAAVIIVAALVVAAAVGSDPADARARRKRAHSAYKPPYAAIVVDANSGKVLHAANADALRHPASLTKIMTLYLLFEQLEAGKLKPESRLEVSEHASAQAPSKLGLKPGQTLTVEDAIKALVTKSANDAAVVVAEAIAGDEESFARRMTRKARALGMTKTVYTNASGLPDDDQVTSARDQSILGRAIQDRFPRYYRYFATSSFQYRGVSMRNHNKLLGRVAGVDGIKTGYTHASGFNLVSSLKRGNRHLVAVVMGGTSGPTRDARMRALLSEHIETASVHRSAAKIAETGAPAPASEKRAESAPSPISTKRTAPAPARQAPQAVSPDHAAVTSSVTTPGSSEPIRPVAVKTIVVRAGGSPAGGSQAGGSQTAALALVPSAAPMAASASAPQAPPEQDKALPTQQNPVAAARAYTLASVEPKPNQPPGARPGVLGTLPAQTSSGPAENGPVIEHEISASATAAVEKASASSRPRHSGWVIQVGAFPNEGEAKERLKAARHAAKSLLSRADPFTEQVAKGATTLYRARFAGFDQRSAEAACKQLKRNDIVCMALKQ